jgi:hypothetical protein
MNHHLKTESATATKNGSCGGWSLSIIFLFNLFLLLTAIEQCSCHVSQGQYHYGNSLLDRITTTNSERKIINPISLGIQRALAQSSLSSSWGSKSYDSIATQPTRLSSSSTLLARHDCIDDDDEEEDFMAETRATRFASVQPKEQSEITITMKPHLKQKKKKSMELIFGRRLDMQQQLKTMTEEELLSNYNLDCDDEFEQSSIPCSVSSTHPAALQGKFGPQNPRRQTPTSATATTTATTSKDATTRTTSTTTNSARGGSTAVVTAATAVAHRPLFFWENMVSGAVSRSVAQTIMHPANTMKTMLQSSREFTFRQLLQPQMFRRLTVGAGANFVLSIPHGAVNFAVLEFVRGRFSVIVDSVPFLEERKDAIGPGLDFLSSAVSTITCSIVSTPQMMITDVCTTLTNWKRLFAYTFFFLSIIELFTHQHIFVHFTIIYRTLWLVIIQV